MESPFEIYKRKVNKYNSQSFIDDDLEYECLHDISTSLIEVVHTFNTISQFHLEDVSPYNDVWNSILDYVYFDEQKESWDEVLNLFKPHGFTLLGLLINIHGHLISNILHLYILKYEDVYQQELFHERSKYIVLNKKIGFNNTLKIGY